jgi:peptidoglycan-N-acetylglucosamine deacetylase
VALGDKFVGPNRKQGLSIITSREFCSGILIAALLAGGLSDLRAQNAPIASRQSKVIAITIDDLPLNGPRIEIHRLQTMTGKILAGIRKYQIPAVGFVNESLLYVPNETDARIALLQAWSDAGVELGNHTFGHLGFKDTSLKDYQDDFIRGETVTKMVMKQKRQEIRYFRHPYLQMGPTRELEKSFEGFIAERGYRIAQVTIDTMDWMFLAAYAGALTRHDSEMTKRVSEEYLKFAERKFDFCERVAGDLFGHPIKHILLLHANELNADNIDGLVRMIKARGYEFIPLELALQDPVYQYPDEYQSTSDWLSLWAFNKGRRLSPPIPPEFIQKVYADSQKSVVAR